MLILMLYVYKCFIAYLFQTKLIDKYCIWCKGFLTIMSAAFCCMQGWGSTKSSLKGLHYWPMLSLFYHNDDNIKAKVVF